MNRQKQNWILDLILLVGYLLAFYLDFTGVVLHQWIGLAVTTLAVMHLMLHWDWVKAVVTRLFKKKNGRNRTYALIDFLLMLGLGIIFISGLLISTWFNINLYFYGLIRDIHVWVSVATLGITILKLWLHRQWIITVTNKIFRPIPSIAVKPSNSANVPVTASLKPQVDRRQFLVMMGVVTGASAVALSNVFGKSFQTQFVSQEDTSTSNNLYNETQSVAIEQPTEVSATAEQTEVTTATSSATEIQEPAAEPTATSAVLVNDSSASTSCTVLCNKHCAYPGHCRRYTDTNNNGYCDNGECI